jgi:5-methylcytosine-specific restriction endonuclease McrBC GTP-binding regulatory subunit McrB
MNLEKLQKYWNDYKKYFELPKSEHKEKYKWVVLNQVYRKWNWNVDDVCEMYKNAFLVDGSKNLWESGNFYPIKHTLWMFENFKDETINEFNNLFNEQIELHDRIKSFINFYNLKLPELQKLVPDKKINYHSHKDFRAIALYLTLQYPEKYFLYKFTMFKNFSQKLELPKIKAGDHYNLVNYIDLSNEVLNFIKRDSDFIKSYKEFTSEVENYNDDSLHLLTQDFIYTIASHFNEGKKYWRVGSKDGDSSYFNKMLNDNYIAIGWNAIGNLEEQEVDDKKVIQQFLLDKGYKYKTNNVLSRKAGEIYDFYSNASINDIVTLMDGNTVLAIGNITSDYNFDDSKPFSHFREVKWLKKEISNFNISYGLQTTFYPLKISETIKRIESELKSIPSTITNINVMSKSNKTALNQILYGAPGTGKTYTTKKLAIEIIDNQEYDENDRKTILDRYDELVKTNQIHFTTFHQSMSYEDFIEGIKPETIDSRVTYEVKDGIFKRLALLASKEISKTKVENASDQKKLLFDDAWNKLIEETQESIENGGVKSIYTITNKELEIKAISNQGNLIIKPKVENALEYTISYNRTKRLFETFPDLKEVKNIDKDFRTIIGGSNSTAYWSVINYIHKILNENSIKKETLKPEKLKKFVMIIDEINRGNVSAIFGELITLIEDDKRKAIINQKQEHIEVELPYSGDKFSVPDNLYIIGTMNTADRSVEALDTALRRRFSFVEMPSKPKELANKVLEGAEKIDLVKLLETINQRIELLIDKDHQIGHSFFINLKNFDELKFTFKNKILPLLEEYFFGDFGKIGLVLGEKFISVKNGNENKGVLAKFEAYDDVTFLTEKKIYQINDCNDLKVEDFISIYE